MKERITGRLRWLRNWELFDIFLFFLLLFLYWRRSPTPNEWWLRLYAVLLLNYILLQGVLYWHLKLATLASRPYLLPPWFAPLFQRLKRSNQFLLLLYPALAIALLALNRTSLADLIWSLPMALFAGLEYINYYHYQLMHDTMNDIRYLARHRTLRRSALASDLTKAKDASL